MPVPLATYRVQMHAGFGFDAAAAIADYLRDLGVTHLYSSPYLQAGKGSTHGYDVLDHSKPNAELGGPEAPRPALPGPGRGRPRADPRHRPQPHEHRQPRQQLVVGRPRERPVEPVRRLLRRRLAARPRQKLRDTVLMPILGDHYGREVEAGHVQLQRDPAGPSRSTTSTT